MGNVWFFRHQHAWSPIKIAMAAAVKVMILVTVIITKPVMITEIVTRSVKAMAIVYSDSKGERGAEETSISWNFSKALRTYHRSDSILLWRGLAACSSSIGFIGFRGLGFRV